MKPLDAISRVDDLPATVEVLVVGGGPAGAMAAVAAARAGCRTLLVDRVAHPREKVCGCCLSPFGRQVLERAGMTGVLKDSRNVDTVHLHCRGRSVRVRREGTAVLARSALDAALLREAEEAGVSLAWPFVARLRSDGIVTLRGPGGERSVRARLRVVADGLHGGSLQDLPRFAWSVRRRSRIGLGALLPADALLLDQGEIGMLVDHAGYAGAVRLPDGRIDVAAAVRPDAIRRHGGTAACMEHLLGDLLRDRAALTQAAWHGTPQLWRRRRHLHDGNTLVTGDAAGYVEPFTGEGMGWALATGAAAGAHAAAVLQARRSTGAWDAQVRSLTGTARARCGMVAWALRHPTVVAAGLRAADGWPWLASRVAESMGARRTEACLS